MYSLMMMIDSSFRCSSRAMMFLIQLLVIVKETNRNYRIHNAVFDMNFIIFHFMNYLEDDPHDPYLVSSHHLCIQQRRHPRNWFQCTSLYRFISVFDGFQHQVLDILYFPSAVFLLLCSEFFFEKRE